MKVGEFAKRINAHILTGEAGIDREITGVYACDLLSWVMSHAGRGDAWLTVHTHLNTIAVAVLTEISCIVIPEGIPAEEATIKKAVQEGIPVLGTDLSVYGISCIAHDSGV